MTTRFISFVEVLSRIPFSRMHIHRLMDAGEFPRSVQIGAHKVAWVEAEVAEWMERRIAARADASDKNHLAVQRHAARAIDGRQAKRASRAAFLLEA
jgi:prophage regulatory protein